MAVFTGVGVALLTFFADDGALDAPATAAFAAQLVDVGVHAVVVAGTTGEAATLDPEERIRLLRSVRAAVPAATPVIAGTGAPSARQAVRLTRDAFEHGADAVLALSPPGASDVRPYYDAVAAAAAGPDRLLAYHYPGVSSPGIPLPVLRELPVAGCKDSSGDAGRLLEEITTFSGALYTGSAALLSFAGPLGCTGAILSLANLDPERCARAFSGDVDAQRTLAETNRASGERFPGALKEQVALLFGTPVATR